MGVVAATIVAFFKHVTVAQNQKQLFVSIHRMATLPDFTADVLRSEEPNDLLDPIVDNIQKMCSADVKASGAIIREAIETSARRVLHCSNYSTINHKEQGHGLG